MDRLSRLWAQMTDTVLRRLFLAMAVLSGPFFLLHSHIVHSGGSLYSFTTDSASITRALIPIPALLIIVGAWALLELRCYIRGRWKDWSFVALFVFVIVSRVARNVDLPGDFDLVPYEIFRALEKTVGAHIVVWPALLLILMGWCWVFGNRESAKTGNPEI